MALPTLTLDEVSAAIQASSTPANTKKVLEGMLNDFMDLQYGKETPYTTGKQILPSETTIADVDSGIRENDNQKYKRVFTKISDTFKAGDLTPQTNNGTWDPKFHPVLVLITPNN